ncbi:MAG: hypothetical protein LBI18_16210 [Planctomycetaceae bacterium]|jgi:hypothetical protein|nr:hypothetical protein [Planctomycetaceae bacterium]
MFKILLASLTLVNPKNKKNWSNHPVKFFLQTLKRWIIKKEECFAVFVPLKPDIAKV